MMDCRKIQAYLNASTDDDSEDRPESVDEDEDETEVENEYDSESENDSEEEDDETVVSEEDNQDDQENQEKKTEKETKKQVLLNTLQTLQSELLQMKQQLLTMVNNTEFPSNPLDELIDQLGGEGKVAEMTGRRHRILHHKPGWRNCGQSLRISNRF